MRLLQAFVTVLCAAPICAVACVDPRGDFDDYVKRTEKYRMSGEGGATDSMAPTMSVKATYYLVCLPSLAAGNVNETFRFHADSEFTPDMTGGGGKLTLKLTPMIIRDQAGTIVPPTTLKDEMKGVLMVKDVPVAPSGKFTANFGTAMVEKYSNPISFRDITVMDTTVVGIFQEKDYCGGLTGLVTAPITQDLLAPSMNPCLFKQLQVGSMLPMLQTSDFTCPGI